MSKGKLILVPTPIDDESPLELVAKGLLEQAVINRDIICVEDEKPGRRRWLRFGLDREAIKDFVLYNEHTHKTEAINLLKAMKKGKTVYLMSDCGLPAFCDPGQNLVEMCHNSGITVTSTPFANSISLAVALSGFPHNRFVFEGFIPIKSELRMKEMKRIMNSKAMSILMDTPYRMTRILEEMAKFNSSREIFIGIELNGAEETLLRGTVESVLEKVRDQKKEYVIVVGPL